MITVIPGETVSIISFNIGKLVKDKLPNIKLSGEILDNITKTLITYPNYSNNGRGKTYNGTTVLRVYKNYDKFIVKLEIVKFLCITDDLSGLI